MTLAEKTLWAELRKARLNIRRQLPIGPYLVDFVRHAADLVFEVDGGVHRLPDVAARDAVRTAWLEARGYTVLRFTNEEVLANLESVAGVICAAAAPPSQPSPRRRGRAFTRSPARFPETA